MLSQDYDPYNRIFRWETMQVDKKTVVKEYIRQTFFLLLLVIFLVAGAGIILFAMMPPDSPFYYKNVLNAGINSAAVQDMNQEQYTDQGLNAERSQTQ